jgi:hypothetical protein
MLMSIITPDVSADVYKASGIKSKSPVYEASGIKQERKNRRTKNEIEGYQKGPIRNLGGRSPVVDQGTFTELRERAAKHSRHSA